MDCGSYTLGDTEDFCCERVESQFWGRDAEGREAQEDVTCLLVYCTLRFVGGKCCGFFTDILEP